MGLTYGRWSKATAKLLGVAADHYLKLHGIETVPNGPTFWLKQKVLTRWWRRLSCNVQRGNVNAILNAHFAGFSQDRRR